MPQAGTALQSYHEWRMFQRFTERARRSLFFARHEASVLASLEIETHHLLMGLVKDQHELITRLIETAGVTPAAIRQAIYDRAGIGTSSVATSVEIPFSEDVKQVLQYAVEEADILLHQFIGLEHLLLGLLRLERGLAWDILHEKGLALATVREALVMHASATSPLPGELAGLLAAIVPGAAPRPHRPGPFYLMTTLDRPRPGRRPVADVAGTGFTNVSVSATSAHADHPRDSRVHSFGPLSMAGATLAQLALLLEGFLGAPVMVEDDGMAGVFDIELQGMFESADTLIVALRDQLGLDLVKSLG